LGKITLAALVIVLVIGGYALCEYFLPQKPQEYPLGLSDVEKAALKADRIQARELEDVTRALRENDAKRVIWGDRFLRWTVLAYTLWRIDQGDVAIILRMEDLMVSYYEHAWYPNVKKAPQMPFPGLIQYFRADGTWEDYWNDYKPVYAAAFLLEYYVLSSFDRDWGTRNYGMLRNVADSVLEMWLPARHQPAAYVDAFRSGGIEVVEIKNITSSVDSAMVYSALVASAQLAKSLANDLESYSLYNRYAEDLRASFYDQRWDWFPTQIFGQNAREEYGTAIQIGMTLPDIDADDKIDALKKYLVNNLRVSQDSWLLKWKKDDQSASARSVMAAAGLAPKYSVLAWDILNSYARAALSNDPWLISKTDGYEGEDPIWVSGKFLETYVFFKARFLTGRIAFSPRLLRGNFSLETWLSSQRIETKFVRASIPTLYGPIGVGVNLTQPALAYSFHGAFGQNVTVTLHTLIEPRVSANARLWGSQDIRNLQVTVVWFVSEGTVEVRLD